MIGLVLALHRVRIPLYYVSAVLFIGGIIVGDLLPPPLPEVLAPISRLGLAGLVVAILTVVLGGRLLRRPATETVAPPVTGRWLAVNSPATKEPSHGVHAYGQTFAIDLVHDPEDATRPAFEPGPMRPASDFTAFGQPVSAMVDGEVISATDGQRDHRSRSSAAAILYMTLEGMVRELGGPRFVVGNHVTIRTPDGTHALVAHLRQGSLRVAVGDTVRAGQQIGECGNSGNSSVPHVHAQLMDRSSLWTARGIPMTFADIHIDGAPRDGLPGNEEHMSAA